MAVILISCHSDDQTNVSPIARALEQEGHVVAVEPWRPPVSDDLPKRVRQIESSDYFVYCVPGSEDRAHWKPGELDWAQQSQEKRQRPRILPAQLGANLPPRELEGLEIADFSSSWDVGLKDLKRAIDWRYRALPSVRIVYAPDDRQDVFHLGRGLQKDDYHDLSLLVGQPRADRRANDPEAGQDLVILFATRCAIGSRSTFEGFTDCRHRADDYHVVRREADAHTRLWKEQGAKFDSEQHVVFHNDHPESTVRNLVMHLEGTDTVKRRRRSKDLGARYLEAVRRTCEEPDIFWQSFLSTGWEAFIRPVLLPADVPSSEAVDLGSLLLPGSRSIVLGRSGSGKSTLLKWLAVECAYRARGKHSQIVPAAPVHRLIPIIVSLRHVSREHLSGGMAALAASMTDTLELDDFDVGAFNDWLRPLLGQGDVVVLVDGMDQVDCSKHIGHVAGTLGKMVTDYPQVRCIVMACERSTWTAALGFTEYRLAPLDSDSQLKLLTAFLAKVSTGPISAPAPASTHRTPFETLLSAIDWTSSSDKSPAQLLSRVVRCLLKANEWPLEVSQVDLTEPGTEQLVRYLAYLAICSLARPDERLIAEVANRWSQECYRSYPEIYGPGVAPPLDLLLRHTTLLFKPTTSGGDQRELAFTHAHFRDYFAAEAMLSLRWRGDGNPLLRQIQEMLADYGELERWRDVVHFWLLLDRTAEAVHEVNSDYGLEQESPRARLVRAEIALAAMLDGLVVDNGLLLSVLRSFADAIARLWNPDLPAPALNLPLPASNTLHRVRTHDDWRSRFLDALRTMEEELLDDGVGPKSIESLRQFMNEAAPPATSPAPEAAPA